MRSWFHCDLDIPTVNEEMKGKLFYERFEKSCRHFFHSCSLLLCPHLQFGVTNMRSMVSRCQGVKEARVHSAETFFAEIGILHGAANRIKNHLVSKASSIFNSKKFRFAFVCEVGFDGVGCRKTCQCSLIALIHRCLVTIAAKKRIFGTLPHAVSGNIRHVLHVCRNSGRLT